MRKIGLVSLGTLIERESELYFSEINNNKINIDIKDSNKSLIN